MKKVNCRNMRREIEEAKPGDSLRWVVNKHLTTCPACETFAREQTKLREIVSSLGTVEAPGDFDFRLRARLAGEKRQPAGPFARLSFSFGVGAAAIAMLLILAGATILFVSLKSRTNDSAPANVAVTAPSAKSPSVEDARVAEADKTQKPVEGPEAVLRDGEAVAKSSNPERANRTGSGSNVLASAQGNRTKTRDTSSTGALVLKGDQLAQAYPTSAFPIDASYQSLKVSVDDGRGTSRTISLPTVSFGSQRALPQSATPLLVSARGDW